MAEYIDFIPKIGLITDLVYPRVIGLYANDSTLEVVAYNFIEVEDQRWDEAEQWTMWSE